MQCSPKSNMTIKVIVTQKHPLGPMYKKNIFVQNGTYIQNGAHVHVHVHW